MFRKTKVCTGLMLAFGASFGLGTGVANAQQALERVEITGSAIKRVNAEGPAPVEIVTAKDIAKTGATTMNELIRSIPSIDVFDQGELASNSPSGSGTANLRLRGLSSSNLLVLLNGRRLPVNALYDSSGAGAAVDINMIPVSAIARIEILKDGGSAIYGADAVAGVINIITKTDYQGAEVTFGTGISSHTDGKETQWGLSAGFGDLNSDRYNVLLGIDYYKRDPIFRKDRPISSSVDFRRFGAGDGRSSFAPTGNVVDPNTGAFVGLPYAACPADSLVTSNNRCRYDFNKSILTSLNGADRLSALAIASFQVTPDVRAFGELTLARTKDHFEAHPVPDFFNVPITNAAQQPYEDPANPGTVIIAGRFMQGGPRITDRRADMINMVVGAEGTTAGLDWKANVGRGQSKVVNTDRNYYDANLWGPATVSGQLNPTVSTNDPAFVESLKVTPVREGKSTVQYVNLQVGGDAFQLPGGALKYAIGASFLHESLDDQPDPLTQAGEVVGSIAQAAVTAKRNVKAVFGELGIPILKNLEAQAAVRYDSYPGASKTSPKVAIKYSPTSQFALRASYTESFRAPVLKQLYGAQEQGAITLTTEADCAALGLAKGCDIPAFQVNGANPNLKAEKGKTFNLGAVFEVSQNANASVDIWKIHKTDDISAPTIASAIRQGLVSRDGARFFVFTNLQNIAERQTSGVDLDARLRFPGTSLGTLTFRNLLTYYFTNKTRQNGDSEWAEFNDTYATPRFRNVFIASTETGPWTATASLRTVGGFSDSDLPKADIPATTRRVKAHEELDLQAQYAGIAGWTLTAGVKNVLDQAPPLSLTNALDNQYTQMGFAELYTARGRFYYLTANYKFR